MFEWPQSAACGPKQHHCSLNKKGKERLIHAHVPVSGDVKWEQKTEGVTKVRVWEAEPHLSCHWLFQEAWRRNAQITEKLNGRASKVCHLVLNLQSKIPHFFSRSNAGNILRVKTKTTLSIIGTFMGFTGKNKSAFRETYIPRIWMEAISVEHVQLSATSTAKPLRRWDQQAPLFWLLGNLK